MTDDIEEQKINNLAPEIAKLNKKAKIKIIPLIPFILGAILLFSAWIYLTYFKDKTDKNVSNENKVKAEEETRKKEFSFKKSEQQEPAKAIKEEHNFNIKPKKAKTEEPIFRKYKSIPIKSEETLDAVESTNNKELSNNGTEAAIIATQIKIDPNFLISVGTYIPCSLTTRFVSDVAGNIQCTISEDVYSSNGLVKLIEKGTKAIGVYQSGTLSPGKERMLIIWTQLTTPDYKRINLENTQVVGQLGEAGIGGSINSHFLKRFGGAFMVSGFKDVLNIAAERQQKENKNTININNIDNTRDATVAIVEKMLENSINITPTMYKNQGDILGILVGKDIDFSKVYKLKMNK
jgi:type IV secretion system protein VirB10